MEKKKKTKEKSSRKSKINDFGSSSNIKSLGSNSRSKSKNKQEENPLVFSDNQDSFVQEDDNKQKKSNRSKKKQVAESTQSLPATKDSKKGEKKKKKQNVGKKKKFDEQENTIEFPNPNESLESGVFVDDEQIRKYFQQTNKYKGSDFNTENTLPNRSISSLTGEKSKKSRKKGSDNEIGDDDSQINMEDLMNQIGGEREKEKDEMSWNSFDEEGDPKLQKELPVPQKSFNLAEGDSKSGSRKKTIPDNKNKKKKKDTDEDKSSRSRGNSKKEKSTNKTKDQREDTESKKDKSLKPQKEEKSQKKRDEPKPTFLSSEDSSEEVNGSSVKKTQKSNEKNSLKKEDTEEGKRRKSKFLSKKIRDSSDKLNFSSEEDEEDSNESYKNINLNEKSQKSQKSQKKNISEIAQNDQPSSPDESVTKFVKEKNKVRLTNKENGQKQINVLSSGEEEENEESEGGEEEDEEEGEEEEDDEEEEEEKKQTSKTPKNKSKSEKEKIAKNFFLCPYCQKDAPLITSLTSEETKTSVEDKVSILCQCGGTTTSLIDYIQEIEKKKCNINGACYNPRHSKVYGVAYCEKCQKFLCKECLLYHKDYQPEHITSPFKIGSYSKCHEHEKDVIEYCQNCDLGLCQECSEEHNTDHNKLSIEELWQSVYEKLPFKSFPECEEFTDACRRISIKQKDKYIQYIDEFIQKLKKYRKDIEDEFVKGSQRIEAQIKLIKLTFSNFSSFRRNLNQIENMKKVSFICPSVYLCLDNNFLKTVESYIDYIKKQNIIETESEKKITSEEFKSLLERYPLKEKKVLDLETSSSTQGVHGCVPLFFKAYNSKGVYFGECEKKKRHGRGIQFNNNGDVFEGYWNNGHIIKGKIKWANGNEYEGQIKNDRENGKGVKRYKNGEVYKGIFKDGRRISKTLFLEKIIEEK